METTNKPAPKYDREQRLAIIKASNEMLGDAMVKLVERGASQDVIDAIKNSIAENNEYARANYGASEDEIKNARYHGANISEIKAYEDRLRMKGITDESLRRKEMAVVANSSSEDKAGTKSVEGDNNNGDSPAKKRRVRRKKGEVQKPAAAEVESVEVKEPKEDVAEADNNVGAEPQIEGKGNNLVRSAIKNGSGDYRVEDFDLSDVPDYVQYDIIPLPSKGECYPHKKGKIPVAYLTASDENLIASPNMYRDGKLLDIILRRKILDKSINVDELCSGDRDAIILWLRATAYGDDFPITATNTETGKSYDTVVKLSSLKYKETKLKGDENGLFTFNTDNGDEIKFKYLTRSEEISLANSITMNMRDFYRDSMLRGVEGLRNSLDEMLLSKEDRDMIKEDLDEIGDIITNIEKTTDDGNPNIITEQMIYPIVSVNGNTDRDYIKGYVENLRSADSLKFRNFMSENRPGVDLNIKVNIPESDGGGSFDSFLRILDTIFITI